MSKQKQAQLETKETDQKERKPLRQKGGTYFYCGSIINRKNVFVTPEYMDLLANAFKMAEVKKDVKTIAFVIMPNYFYWTFRLSETQDNPVAIYSEVKKDVAIGILNNLKQEINEGQYKLLDIFENNEKVGRSEPKKILWTFSEQAKNFENNKHYRVWTPKTQIRLLDDPELLQEKLSAIRKAPIGERWNMVDTPEAYPYLYFAEDVPAKEESALTKFCANFIAQTAVANA